MTVYSRPLIVILNLQAVAVNIIPTVQQVGCWLDFRVCGRFLCCRLMESACNWPSMPCTQEIASIIGYWRENGFYVM